MKPPTHELECEPAAESQPPIDELIDLPGGWLSEDSLPAMAPRRIEPDELSNFPSEFPAPPALLDETTRIHAVSPVVEPSEAERQRAFPLPAPLTIPVERLRDSVRLAAAVLLFGLVGAAIVVLGALRPPSISPPAKPTSSAQIALPTRPPVIARQPIDDVAPAATPTPTVALAPASTPVTNTPARIDTPLTNRPTATPKVTARKAVPAPIRPTPIPVTDLPNGTTWQNASAISVVGPPPAAPPLREPVASPSPIVTPTPAAALTSTAKAPAAPTPTPTAAAPSPEAAARVARTASVQSVLDRYRAAFNSLDASAVEGFWPDVDVRALNRAFAQLDSQQFRFDHCDIELAGARAFASCRGYAEYVKKAGSRERRTEPRQWAFTFGEAGNGWVILKVDARQTQ